MKGVLKRYVDVAFTAGVIRDFEVPQSWYREYLEGRGISHKILFGERNFNILESATARQRCIPKEDDLPKSFKELFTKGNSAGDFLTDVILQDVVNGYYKLRNWGRNGTTEDKLNQLNIKEFVDFIKKEET